MRTGGFLLLLLWAATARGQISGKVMTTQGEAVPFANVIVCTAADTTIAGGTITDESGVFSYTPSVTGALLLKVSSLGYKTFISDIIYVNRPDDSLALPVIVLADEQNIMMEVNVSARRELVRNTASGKIVHVQGSILTKGSNALQVLERLPGVIVDRRNNQLSLNGQAGVPVLMNGRRLQMPVEELTGLLESTTADNIEKIELITSPDAAYDAEGGVGMINIVFKSNEILGTQVFLSATAGYGFREKGVMTLGLSKGLKRLNINTTYSFNRDIRQSGFAGYGTSANPNLAGPSRDTFYGMTDGFHNTRNAHLTLEYRPSSALKVGTDVSWISSGTQNHNRNGGSWDVAGEEFVGIKTVSDGVNRKQNLISALFLENKLSGRSDIKLEAGYIGFGNDSRTVFTSDYFDRNGNSYEPLNPIFTKGNKGSSSSMIRVGVLKADYSLSFHDKFTAGFGAKGSYSVNGNTSRIDRLTGESWEADPRSQSNITGDERIGALYFNSRATLNARSGLQAGLRYEYWNRTFNNAREPYVISQLFPSVSYTYKINDPSSLSLGYYRRISRPAYTDLISDLFYNDPTSVFGGNPTLKPALSDVVKAEYSNRGFAASLTFQNEKNAILRYQLSTNAANDILILFPQNLDYMKSLTLNLSYPFTVFSWWKIAANSISALRNYRISYSLVPVTRTYMYQNFSYTSHIKLPDNFEVEISGWNNLPFLEGTNRVKGFGVVNLGISKNLGRNRGAFQLALPDLFKSMQVSSDMGGAAPVVFHIESHNRWRDETALYRVIKLTYSRTFGKNVRKVNYTMNEDEKERIRL